MGRHKLIENDALLAIARAVFVEKGIGASTREIAKRAGISEAVIYQRHPTKADLFFAAMVPPAMNIDELLATPSKSAGSSEDLERIALGLLAYFRELTPILLPLMTHPEFKFEEFARRDPESPLNRIRSGLVAYLEAQRACGNVADADVRPAALSLFAALHSLAMFERLGVHGGRFEEPMVRAMVRALWTGLAPATDRS